MGAVRLGTFADCIVSLLKAWKVTVARTECDDSAYQRHFFRMVRPLTFTYIEERLLTVHTVM